MAEIHCRRCGATQPAGALDWSSTVEGDEQHRLCGECTRRHVRDIEGKLDEQWWSSGDG